MTTESSSPIGDSHTGQFEVQKLLTLSNSIHAVSPK